MEEIKIPLVSYEGCRVISGDGDIIQLHEKYLTLISLSTLEKVDDKDELKKEFEYDCETIMFKEYITEITFGYSNAKDKYEVEIYNCSHECIVVVCSTRGHAKSLRDKILEWKLK